MENGNILLRPMVIWRTLQDWKKYLKKAKWFAVYTATADLLNKMKKAIKLILQKIVKVKPTKPFTFDPTFHKPDHFTSGDNYWEAGIRWQTWNWRGKCLGIKFSNKGTAANPLVEIKIYAKEKLSADFVDSLIEEIKYLYNFNLDLSDFYNTFKNDHFLNPILKKWRGMRPGHSSSLYEYLIIGIILQNASVRRS